MATKAQVNNFIATIGPIIQKVAKEKGYSVCSTIIAQAGIESAWGTSSLGYKYHNYFGMKCGSAWKDKSVNLKTKEEYTVGTLTTISDNFRVYGSMEEGVRGYFDFISTKRYTNLKTAKDYKTYATYLKQDGYATSSTYVNTLCNTVTKYNLTQYDDFSNQTINVSTNTQNTLNQSNFVVGVTYTLQSDLYVRDSANGNKMKYDNITYDAKKNAKFDNYGNAILKKGTKVTCCDSKKLETSEWVKIPSGWICGISKTKVYVK